MHNFTDEEYKDIVREVLANGEPRADRTGVGTHSVFGTRMEFDLQAGFPILTTKRVHWKSVVTELLWFLRGDTNIAYLHEHGCTIWDEWADVDGELGPVYGKQWRSFPRYTGREYVEGFTTGYSPMINKPVDQIKEVIEGLRNNPKSRRHLVVAWNPAELDRMALPPCHVLFQFYINNNNELSCQLYQRSVDVGLGLPFNIASYALLTHLIAKELNLGVNRFIHVGGDVHIYDNHRDALDAQINRSSFKAPKLIIADKPLFELKPDDITLEDYQSHPGIKMKVAV